MPIRGPNPTPIDNAAGELDLEFMNDGPMMDFSKFK